MVIRAMDRRYQLVMNEECVKKLTEIQKHTGWSASAVLRLGLSVVYPVVRDGRGVCSSGCLAKKVLEVLRLTGNLRQDIEGRSTYVEPPPAIPRPSRASTVAKDVLRRGKKKGVTK